MERRPEEIDRLYDLYVQYANTVRADIIQANRTLGSPHPEETKLEVISRAEFERLLTQPNDDPGVIRRWVRRIIRGHEKEFPELDAA